MLRETALPDYFYDEQGHLAGEYNASGQLIQEIVWLDDLPVAVLKPGATTQDIYQYWSLNPFDFARKFADELTIRKTV
ncbi:hypothetical protein [Methylobacter sp.]|uniref:hypothetical protein n=1 Tax=Methylobacter sp. TaxID=2051955 RepID=UPI003DA5DCA7